MNETGRCVREKYADTDGFTDQRLRGVLDHEQGAFEFRPTPRSAGASSGTDTRRAFAGAASAASFPVAIVAATRRMSGQLRLIRFTFTLPPTVGHRETLRVGSRPLPDVIDKRCAFGLSENGAG